MVGGTGGANRVQGPEDSSTAVYRRHQVFREVSQDGVLGAAAEVTTWLVPFSSPGWGRVQTRSSLAVSATSAFAAVAASPDHCAVSTPSLP